MHFPPAVWTAPLPMRRFPSVLLHDPNIYLFSPFFSSFSLKSKPFRRALNSNSLPCPAIFPFFNLTSWRHLHDFHGSFLKFFFVFSLFGFCLSFDFCWFFGALQSGNCILPLSIRLALGHLAINFGKLNKKLISKKLKYLSAVIDGKRLASIYY